MKNYFMTFWKRGGGTFAADFIAAEGLEPFVDNEGLYSKPLGTSDGAEASALYRQTMSRIEVQKGKTFFNANLCIEVE